MFISNKVTLLVMTEKGLAFLTEALENYRSVIEAVIIGQDSSVINDFSADIYELCTRYGVPACYRSGEFEIKTEYAMAISWRWLIKHPENKLIVFHDSLLPRYRGFAPLVNALINGETKVGVTALFGAADYDRGDIIAQASISVDYPATINEMIGKITACYIDLGKIVLKSIMAGKSPIAHAQDSDKATYSLWLDENDYKINWDSSASEIRRKIDAVGFPYKGAYCFVDDVKYRIFSAEEIPDVAIENRDAGKVIFIEQGSPVVVCGSGLLLIKACTSEEGVSLLPLKKFRLRFT
ncbi:methionyl-tRNA formyltransferase [Pseudomonas sp. NPDC088890]|uniref:methionyl-tRNA formyltransferase n=1 Tax=Pseudomonas sp. NPDC088890 TaxID=3364458 RepID=UPI00384C2BA9